MSKTKQNKWKVQITENDDSPVKNFKIKAKDGAVVAVGEVGDVDNLTLMASAPELLQMCVDLNAIVNKACQLLNQARSEKMNHLGEINKKASELIKKVAG